jgi:phosphoglucosamine mutase
MPPRLFGTDGVRGTAGVPPLDPATIARLGAALVRALPARARPLRLLSGRDTRESGIWIERALARGVRGAGASLDSAGVIPTPGVAYLASAGAYDAGLVISASHNPFEDNGIKVFSGSGEKFTEVLERRVEAILAEAGPALPLASEAPVETLDLTDTYLAHVRQALPEPGKLGPMHLAFDCAHGATTRAAPRLFRSLGFDVEQAGCAPDGRNINLGCGSTHPELLSDLVRATGCRLGVAFDGDGDRAIFVDGSGRVVDGDAVMLMCAKHLKACGRLRGNAIVATVMSNIGLELALRQAGIDLVRCPVGDKYVMEEMIARNLSLGGEQSGHVIFSDYLFTGDGLVTALSVLRVMADTGRELADLAADFVAYPQVLLNVPVSRKPALTDVPDVAGAMARVEERLGGQGRLLVRYSGTEPLLRVMIEGQDQQQIRTWAEEIADTIRRQLG